MDARPDAATATGTTDAPASARVVVERRGAVTLARMDHGENRLHPELLDALDGVLDEISGHDEPAALVPTGTGKFFSNGLDLDYMAGNPTEAEAILARVHRM